MAIPLTNKSASDTAIVACGTGVGVPIFANNFSGVFEATCLTASEALNACSINNYYVIAVSGMSTFPNSVVKILNTTFKSPCFAFDFNPWPAEIESFLDQSIPKMSKMGSTPTSSDSCKICNLAKR